jgi:PAS domain S-box-containing protein
VNAAFEAATGLSLQGVVGRTLRELPLPVDIVGAAEGYIRSVFTTGQPQTAHIPYPTPRGIREFEVRYIPELAADQSIAAVFSIARDVTEQSSAERALRQSERELATLFDHSPDAILRLDRKLRHLYISATWERLTGISREAVLGKTSRELGLPPAVVRLQENAIRQVIKTRSPMTVEFTYPSQGGPVDYEMRHIPEFEDRRVSSILLMGRDITEQKSLQRLAAANERDIRALTTRLITAQEQERRRVAREIHDTVCQSVGALAAEIGNVAAEFPDSSPAQQRLQETRERALRTAEEARQVAHRLHPAILEDLGLPKALQSLSEEVSQHEGIPIKFRADGPLPAVTMETASCVYRVAQQALENVARHARAKHVTVLLDGRRGLNLSIRDDGVGFDPIAAPKGLGLASMRERARLANGELSVDAKPGHGTRVKLALHLPESAS